MSEANVTQIESKEEPIIQSDNLWNIGMGGELEILKSSQDGLAHSCKIRLSFFRKGTFADAKAPNFGDRLARRSKHVSGIFQLTEGTHTLLATLAKSESSFNHARDSR